MIRPSAVIRWGEDKPLKGNHKTRKNVALIYGGGLVVFFIAFIIAVPTPEQYELIAEPTAGEVPLEVSFKADSNKSLEENFDKVKWEFGDGTTELGKEVVHKYEAEGNFEVVLTLIGENTTKTLTENIAVNNALPKAVISFNKQQEYPPLQVEFDGRQSSDKDDEIVEYEWDFGGNTKTGERVTHTFQEPGTHKVKLTVTDEDSGSATETRTIKIAKPTPVAVINTNKTSGYKPLEIDFDASESTIPKGEIETYKWDFGDGLSREGKNVSHTYKQAGEFEVTLTTVSRNGYKGTSSTKIQVNNRPPEASLEVASIEGLEVKFDLTGTRDPDGSIEKYELRFGDGEVKEGTGTTKSVTHIYEEPGIYNVELLVIDDSGVRIRAPMKKVKAGNVVSINGEEQKYYPPQTRVHTESFSFSVFEEPKYRETIGGTYGKSAGVGAIYLLVPVKITNLTSESRSLSLTTSWEVIDLDQGYTYEVATGADAYLDSSDRLETHRIPPDLSRNGYLVFEINKTSRGNKLVLKKEAGVLFSNSYYFAINFR